jgi:4-amino-4-deoxy-L-arabinose transferase-like glycosyltransferase
MSSRKSKIQNRDAGPLSPLPPETAVMRGAMRLALPVLLALYLVFASFHAIATPTGQTGYQDAPDEAAHVAFVRTLATSGRLPTQVSSEPDPQAYEWHQPPLYYVLGVEALAFGPRMIRIVSIVCGFFAIVLVFQIARLLVPNEPLIAICAAGIAALTPSHIAILSAVNNDSLLEVGFSLSLLLMLQALRSGFTTWRAGWIGVAIGITCLTKATGVLLFPVLLFALYLYYRSGEAPRALLLNAVWCLIISMALCGWWYGRNYALYGELLPIRAFNRAFSGTVRPGDVISGRVGLQVDGWGGYFALAGQWSFQSFWAVYATPRSALVGSPLFLPLPVYTLFAGLSAAMAAGLTILHFRRKTVFSETQRHEIWLLFAVTALVGLSFFGFLLHYFQAQGRYMYPAMGAIATLGSMGWLALFPQKYKPAATGGLLLFLLAIGLIYFGK